jgi:cytidine deaminase
VQAGNGFALPCGLCRQKIREFAEGPQAKVIAVNLNKQGQIRHVSVTDIGAIYPLSFTPDCLA